MTGQFISFIGLPASGKSTIRKELLKDGEVDEAISPDDIRFYEFGTQFNPKIEHRVWSIAKARMGNCLSQGKKCLLDATNTEPRQREDFASIAKDFNTKTKAIVLNIDFDLTMSRNRQRKEILVGGRRIGQTVPDYAMFRMKQQWDTSGMGHTEESIKSILQDEFDEIEIINRYADEKDCKEMDGKITKGDKSGRKMCRVTFKDDISITSKYHFME